MSEISTYDAGLLNDFGGGDVEWWQDYIRAELGRAHDHYDGQYVCLASELNRLRDENERLRGAISEIERLRLATDEGTLAKRADRIWEIACEMQGRPVPGAKTFALNPVGAS